MMEVKTNYKAGNDVELAIKIVDLWHSDSRNFHKMEPDWLQLARLVIQRGNEVEETFKNRESLNDTEHEEIGRLIATGCTSGRADCEESCIAWELRWNKWTD